MHRKHGHVFAHLHIPDPGADGRDAAGVLMAQHRPGRRTEHRILGDVQVAAADAAAAHFDHHFVGARRGVGQGLDLEWREQLLEYCGFHGSPRACTAEDAPGWLRWQLARQG
jgi:hypothetical protein